MGGDSMGPDIPGHSHRTFRTLKKTNVRLGGPAPVGVRTFRTFRTFVSFLLEKKVKEEKEEKIVKPKKI